MEKLVCLLGQNPEDNTIVLIAHWEFTPKQEIIDKLKNNLDNKYSKFILVQDILFMEGKGVSSVYYTDY